MKKFVNSNSNLYDIIAVSETWLRPGHCTVTYNLDAYSLHRSDRKNRSGGGVGLYVKNGYKTKVLISSSVLQSDAEVEFLFLEVSFSPSRHLLLGVVYRPPHVPLTSFEEILADVSCKYEQRLILGDWNVNVNSTSPDSIFLKNLCTQLNYHLVEHDNTFHALGSSSRIDLCLVSDARRVVASGQLGRSFLSGHDLIHVVLDVGDTGRNACKTVSRNVRSIDPDTLHSSVWEITEQVLHLPAGDVDGLVDVLSGELYNVLERLAPPRNVTGRRPSAPWITAGIREMIRVRDSLRRSYRRNGTYSILTRYRDLRNTIKARIQEERSKFLTRRFSHLQNTPGIWRELKRFGIISPSSASSALPSHLTPSAINNHFLSIHCSSPPSTPSFLSLPPVYNDNKFYFSHITPELLAPLVTFPTTSVLPSDGLTPLFLSMCGSVLLPVMLRVFNESLTSSVFPRLWKLSHITPIPKIPSPQSPSDLRPISILPEMSKVLERVVLKQVRDYLNSHGLADPFQHGFVKGRSTQTALLVITEDVRRAIDNREITILTCFDFSKAFDTVDHGILMERLRELNFSSSVLSWCWSYLTGRYQAVRIGDQYSSWQQVNSGVPQGSVLGPFFFALYLRDVNAEFRHCKIVKYADDLQIYLHAPFMEVGEGISKINDDITRLVAWSSTNKLALNPGKTQCMLLGSSRFINMLDYHNLPPVRVADVNVPFLNVIKSLGIHLQPSLGWNEHVSRTCAKIYATLASLHRHKNTLSRSLRATLVTSLIFPHIDYCCLLHLGMTDVLETRLQRALNACIRFVFDLRRDVHVTPYFERLGWLKVPQRRAFFLGVFMFTVHRGTASDSLQGMFSRRSEMDVRSSPRHSRLVYNTPLHRTATRSNSLAVQGGIFWNALPVAVREACGVGSFKRRLHRALLDGVVTP